MMLVMLAPAAPAATLDVKANISVRASSNTSSMATPSTFGSTVNVGEKSGSSR